MSGKTPQFEFFEAVTLAAAIVVVAIVFGVTVYLIMPEAFS